MEDSPGRERGGREKVCVWGGEVRKIVLMVVFVRFLQVASQG